MAFQASKTVAELSREYYEFTVNVVERTIDGMMPSGASAEDIYLRASPAINQAFPEMVYTRERLEMDLETLLVDSRASCDIQLWRTL